MIGRDESGDGKEQLMHRSISVKHGAGIGSVVLVNDMTAD